MSYELHDPSFDDTTDEVPERGSDRNDFGTDD